MRILIVEDDHGIRTALEFMLELEGHQPQTVDRGELALELLRNHPFDIVLLDLSTNGISVDEFFAQLGEVHPPIGIVSGNTMIANEANRVGADFFVRKPFDQDELMDQLQKFGMRSERVAVHAVKPLPTDLGSSLGSELCSSL